MTKSALILLLALPMACSRNPSVALNGRVEAYLSDLGPRVAGTLTELRVQEGQRVKAGDLLARISADELEAAVRRDRAGLEATQAKQLELAHGTRREEVAQGEARLRDAAAAATLAEENLGRAQTLFRDRVMAKADLDKARSERDRAQAALALQRQALTALQTGARVEQREGALAETRKAQAVLEQSRLQAGFLELRAPFDGVVVHRLREPGTVLAAGQAVLTLARQDSLWVRVYLPQPLQPRLSQGMPVQVATLDHRVFSATLDEVASESEYTPKMVETAEERVNLVYPARVRLAQGWDQGLLPGTSVEVRFTPRSGQ